MIYGVFQQRSRRITDFWLSPLEQGLAFGALSTSWRATEMTTQVQMLMCDKVTLEFDRQQPIIPILYFDAENSIIHSINYVIIGAANLANKYV